MFTDKSQLLLCGEMQKVGMRVDQADLQEILKDNRSPRCLPNKDILLYTGQCKTYAYYHRKISCVTSYKRMCARSPRAVYGHTLA